MVFYNYVFAIDIKFIFRFLEKCPMCDDSSEGGKFEHMNEFCVCLACSFIVNVCTLR